MSSQYPEEKCVVCEICDKRFTTVNNLTNHEVSYHKDNSKNSWNNYEKNSIKTDPPIYMDRDENDMDVNDDNSWSR